MSEMFRNPLNGAVSTPLTLTAMNALGSAFTGHTITNAKAFVANPAGAGPTCVTGTSAAAAKGYVRLDSTFVTPTSAVTVSWRVYLSELPQNAGSNAQLLNMTARKADTATRSGPALNVQRQGTAVPGQLQLAAPNDATTAYIALASIPALTAGAWYRVNMAVDQTAGIVLVELRDAADNLLGSQTWTGDLTPATVITQAQIGKTENTSIVGNVYLSQVAWETDRATSLGVPSMTAMTPPTLMFVPTLDLGPGQRTYLAGYVTPTAPGATSPVCAWSQTGKTAPAAPDLTLVADGTTGAFVTAPYWSDAVAYTVTGSASDTTGLITTRTVPITVRSHDVLTGTPGGSGSAAFTGAGVLTAIGALAGTGLASLTGTGTLTALGTPKPARAVAFTGAGTLTAVGAPAGSFTTGGTGGPLTDRKAVSFTASNSYSEGYNCYASGLNWSQPVGVVFWLHGDGNYEYSGEANPTPSGYIMNGTNGIKAKAKARNCILVVPKTPDDSLQPDGETTWWWWDGKEENARYFRDLVAFIFTKYNIDLRRVWFGSHSGGSQFLTQFFLPWFAADLGILAGGCVFFGGGQAPAASFVPLAVPYNMQIMRWVCGQNDTVGFNAVAAMNAGKAWYQGQGFTTESFLVPGKPHDISTSQGDLWGTYFAEAMDQHPIP